MLTSDKCRCLAKEQPAGTKKAPHWALFFCFRLCLLAAEATETLFETINTAANVQYLLLTGIERVAFGAHIDINILGQSGAGFDDIATAAGGIDVRVVWMNISFHGCVLKYEIVPPSNPIVEYRTRQGRK